MAKKVPQEEFEQRIKKVSPDAEFEILKYTTISKPCEIKCLKCGNVKTHMKASNVLRFPFCCSEKNSEELAIDKINQTEDFTFIRREKGSKMLVKHDKCQNIFKRNLHLIIKNPNHCPFCDDNKGIVLDIEEIQKRLDEEFNKTIKILEYNAIRTKNTYKCLKCGLIFQQTQKNLMASRGCPKCDRFKSKGEKRIAQILDNHGIYYQEQIGFEDLTQGKQKFDFVVYKDRDYKEIDYFIECQGEQHYEEKNIFRDSLEKIQERDQRKRDWCKKHNYKLYEIIYIDGELLNLEILPFKN